MARPRFRPLASTLCVPQGLLALSSAYFLGLLLAARSRPRHRSVAAPGGSKNEPMRLAVLIPAHDEEEGIATTLESLLDGDYPASARRVIVVADNCSDATAARAAATGAEVWERTDPANRGKGFALA